MSRQLGAASLAGLLVTGIGLTAAAQSRCPDSRYLPQLTIDQINEMSDKDSRAHADCTKNDALEALRKNGAELAAFVAGLSDDDLDRKGSMPAFGGEASVNQIINFVIFQSAQEHFDNIKNAVGK